MESILNNPNDYAALESDLLLLSFMYERTNAPDCKWNELNERIDYLKSLIYNGK